MFGSPIIENQLELGRFLGFVLWVPRQCFSIQKQKLSRQIPWKPKHTCFQFNGASKQTVNYDL